MLGGCQGLVSLDGGFRFNSTPVSGFIRGISSIYSLFPFLNHRITFTLVQFYSYQQEMFPWLEAAKQLR